LKAPVKFDEYYLIERVAVGGMAEVFKGVSYGAEGFERVSAVKRVLPHVAEDKDFIEMFIDEAQIAAQLQHPNIGQVYHLGQRDERYFIAMEFISGQDLRAIFDRARELQQPLDLAWCAYIIREVCGALEYAHLKRDSQQRPMHLIHRDVSPQNILVGYDGGVKLIDFGIAKASNKINKTQVGILKGKFSYMSPEQARGHQLDPRTDLFALAIVLYELITLERCFLGQTDFSTIERVRNIEYTSPRKIRRDIPAALEKIVQKGLSRDPNDRYQSASDFQEALTKFLQRHAPRFTRAQGHQYIQRLFRAEIEAEQLRFDEFRRYATEHIP
jgi:eukaryotic-like serine/threonine-protein kinase